MKRLLLSVLTVGAVGAAAVYTTTAFFSDTETSTGNTFVAGAIDLKVDAMAHYAGMYCDLETGTWFDEETQSIEPQSSQWPDLLGTGCTGSWELTDLDESHVFFDYGDLKPGDEGESTINLHVQDNDAWACVSIVPTLNDDNGSTEPELEAGDAPDGDSIFDGELAQNMHFSVWADVCDETGNYPNAYPGDNIYQDGCDLQLTEGTGFNQPVTWALADANTPNIFTNSGPLAGGDDYYIGVSWGLPTDTGNMVQTDKYMADISFEVVQSRNNPDFVCPVPDIVAQPNTLRLENEQETEEGPWEVLSEDEIYADLTWTDGETFDYTLVAQGLAPSTEYSLIYYADGWPGNNPGALLGTHTTDSSGDFNEVGDVELNMDLPHPNDGNYAVGAKIWLIPSTAYDDGTKSVTVWPPDFNTWLFEGNTYIHYDDTGI